MIFWGWWTNRKVVWFFSYFILRTFDSNKKEKRVYHIVTQYQKDNSAARPKIFAEEKSVGLIIKKTLTKFAKSIRSKHNYHLGDIRSFRKKKTYVIVFFTTWLPEMKILHFHWKLFLSYQKTFLHLLCMSVNAGVKPNLSKDAYITFKNWQASALGHLEQHFAISVQEYLNKLFPKERVPLNGRLDHQI